VAMSPQCAQNFAFLLGSINGLTVVNTFFVLHSPKTCQHKIGHYFVACYFYQSCKNIRTPHT